jgi:murein L,D-transpeptidase YafK
MFLLSLMRTKAYLLFAALLAIYSISWFHPSSLRSPNITVKKRNEMPTPPLHIVVDKSDYEMHISDVHGWWATYPVVFGSKDLSDKLFEGDRRTPDGSYKIVIKKHHKKWGPTLLLDYPTAENQALFEKRKKQGLIPKHAKIGGGIAIHGTRPEEEWTIDNYYNWTDGCISVRYSEMVELYDIIPVGTTVEIIP